MTKKRRSVFKERVLRVVSSVPRGKVISYGQVAFRAGFPGAARAVGSLMCGNADPRIPCHRVVRSDGRAGDYNQGGSEVKIRRLRKEGVEIIRGRITKSCFLSEKW